MDEGVVYQKWLDFFMPHTADIRAKADSFPDVRSFEVDFQQITDMDLIDFIMTYPADAIRIGEASIKSLLEPDQANVYMNLRLFNLYKSMNTNIRNLRSSDVSMLKSIEGEIRKVTDIKGKYQTGAFICSSCGFKIEVHQDGEVLDKPLDCPKDDGGCGKRAGSTTFRFEPNSSLAIDYQKILLQEKREDLRGHQQPKNIEVVVLDDLVGEWTPGDVVRVNGVIGVKLDGGVNNKLTTFTKFINANYIDKENIEGYHVNYSIEEIDDITDKMGGNVLDTLIKSFAPHIHGMERLKEVLLYQLVGGSTDLGYRGEIMCVVVGDPGTGKSKLCEWACSLIPGSVVIDASEGNITANGLKASAVKENVSEFGEGNWTLEAGALVMSHHKMFMLDESHLAKKEIIGALHVPMEEQEFSVAKAGLSRKFICQFSGIFVMNPEDGRFIIDERTGRNDRFIPLIDLIDTKKFSPPFLDRIDYYCPVYDPNDEDRDRQIAQTIRKQKRGETKAILTKEEIMKYIAYVKDNYNPTLPESLDQLDDDQYVKMRKGDGSGPQAYTRHLLSVHRFAEASAKLKAREEVDEDDYMLAVKIVTESLRCLTGGISGEIDVNAQIKGYSKNKESKYERIQQLIAEMNEDNDNRGASETDLILNIEADGIDNGEKLISQLVHQGSIRYQQKDDVKLWWNVK